MGWDQRRSGIYVPRDYREGRRAIDRYVRVVGRIALRVIVTAGALAELVMRLRELLR